MSFETLAPHYSWMEKVLAGARLQRCRTAWLEELHGCETILMTGVGHGHFLRACARRFPTARIVAVDASEGMLARARRGVAAADVGRGVEFVHAHLPEWVPRAETFDAIVTHFFLDCFPPETLQRVVAGLAHGARAKARWLLSDFAVPDRGWQRHRAKLIHAAMYAFFRPIAGVRARRITPPDPLLRANGFSLRQRRTFEWGLLHADLWQRSPDETASEAVELVRS